MTFWIVVASKDHVESAVRGGFIQAGHGKRSAVERFQRGDVIICYSSKLTFLCKQPLQAFTAVGQVMGEQAMRVQQTEAFAPYRKQMQWLPCREIAIRPLIERLTFIKNKKSWGYVFRVGVLRIPEDDAQIILAEMHP